MARETLADIQTLICAMPQAMLMPLPQPFFDILTMLRRLESFWLKISLHALPLLPQASYLRICRKWVWQRVLKDPQLFHNGFNQWLRPIVSCHCSPLSVAVVKVLKQRLDDISAQILRDCRHPPLKLASKHPVRLPHLRFSRRQAALEGTCPVHVWIVPWLWTEDTTTRPCTLPRVRRQRCMTIKTRWHDGPWSFGSAWIATTIPLTSTAGASIIVLSCP